MNTLIRPRIPSGSGPRDDDPTGVRALLSSLPAPDPMPDHLVERINASLAAEQAQRATTMSGAPVTPLLATARRRPRLLFAIAGAAAAVVLVGVVGSSLLAVDLHGGSATSASLDNTVRNGTSGVPQTGMAAPPSAAAKAATPGATAFKEPGAVPAGTLPPGPQIGMSGTRYTAADFLNQARTLRQTSLDSVQLRAAAQSPGAGPAGTPRGLIECLGAISAGGAQLVRADIALYEGQPAVIIVATTHDRPVAYVVGLQCSRTDAALLRPATPLS